MWRNNSLLKIIFLQKGVIYTGHFIWCTFLYWAGPSPCMCAKIQQSWCKHSSQSLVHIEQLLSCSCCRFVSSTPMMITSHYITPLPAWTVDTNQSPLSCSLYQIPTLPSKCRSTNQNWADRAAFLTFYGLILLSLFELHPWFPVLSPQKWHLVWSSAAVKSICYKVWHAVRPDMLLPGCNECLFEFLLSF